MVSGCSPFFVLWWSPIFCSILLLFVTEHSISINENCFPESGKKKEQNERKRQQRGRYHFCVLYRSKSIHLHLSIHFSQDKWLHLQATTAYFIIISSVRVFAICLHNGEKRNTPTPKSIYYQFLLWTVNWINWLKTWQLPFYRICPNFVVRMKLINHCKLKYNLRISHPSKKERKKKRKNTTAFISCCQFIDSLRVLSQ